MDILNLLDEAKNTNWDKNKENENYKKIIEIIENLYPEFVPVENHFDFTIDEYYFRLTLPNKYIESKYIYNKKNKKELEKSIKEIFDEYFLLEKLNNFISENFYNDIFTNSSSIKERNKIYYNLELNYENNFIITLKKYFNNLKIDDANSKCLIEEQTSEWNYYYDDFNRELVDQSIHDYPPFFVELVFEINSNLIFEQKDEIEEYITYLKKLSIYDLL